MSGEDIKRARRRFLSAALSAAAGSLMYVTSLRAHAAGKPAIVTRVRLSSAEARTRVVFELSSQVEYSLLTLHSPDRLVIDFKNTRINSKTQQFPFDDPALRRIRHAARNGTDLRMVLDLAKPVKPKTFLLLPDGQNGHRLVVDLGPARLSNETAQQPTQNIETQSTPLRDVVIAIDAGHGGKDPGAVGKRGTHEKDIVLSVARKLEALIKREKGMRAVLIRDRDVFLPLRERIRRARAAKADLFVSIHADASRNRRAHGSSVYILSRNGASSEQARWLAKKENEADLIGGISLDDKDDVLAGVLLDLSMTGTMEASHELANSLLGSLKQVGKLHSKNVEKAGFVVLKSPDVPSVLVETAFISNVKEEKRLRTQSHQQALAQAMLGGIRNYFGKNAPPGTLLARIKPSRHVIRPGETLSSIAQRYAISVQEIRSYNKISGSKIHSGQVLIIPTRES